MLAEDATQDAFAAALTRWPRDGIPDRPAAWLTTTARNRAIDRLRSARSQRAALRDLTGGLESMDAEDIEDHRLRLIFTCCHPALPLATSTALTLRTVAGLPVPVIARAFLVSETAMAQRLVRARRKIEHAGIPYRVAATRTVGGTAERRSHGVVPGFQRRLHGRRPRRCGGVSRVAGGGCRRPDAVRVRSVWPPRTTAAAIVPAHRATESSWRSAHPRGARPHVVDPFRHRPRRRGAGFCPRARPVRSPGQDRAVSRHRDMCRTDGLVADRRAVRRAPAPVAHASRRAEFARSLSVCGTGPTQGSRCSTASPPSSTASISSRLPRPTCYVGRAALRTRRSATAKRLRSLRRHGSADNSNFGSPP